MLFCFSLVYVLCPGYLRERGIFPEEFEVFLYSCFSLKFNNFFHSVFSRRGKRDRLIQKFPSLKQSLCKMGVLFLCLVFSGAALSQSGNAASAGGHWAAQGIPNTSSPSGPPGGGPSSKWKNVATKGGLGLVNFFFQFAIFQTALTGKIYREYITDSLFYKAPRNPDPGEYASQQFGMEPAKQFAYFYFPALGAEWGMQKLGERWNSPFLKGMAGAFGMGTGFFVSQLFSDIGKDAPLFGECVRSVISDKRKVLHIPACEQVYLNWFEAGKLKEFAVDYGNMLLAGKLSHMLIERTVAPAGASLLSTMGTRASSAASAGRLMFAARFVGGFFAPYLFYTLNFIAFLEINGLLDEHVGKLLKEKSLIHDVSSDIHALKESFDQLDRGKLSNLMGKGLEFLKNATGQAFQDEKAREDLEWLATKDEGRKFFKDVLSRLDSEDLDDLRDLLERVWIEQRYFGNSSNSDELNYVLQDIGVLQGLLTDFESSDLSTEETVEEANDILEDITFQVKTIGFRFARWPMVKGHSYQEAFFFWKGKTDKMTLSYMGVEELLGDISDSTQSIEQLRKQREEEAAEPEKEKELSTGFIGDRVEGLSLEETDQFKMAEYDKQIEEVKSKYRNLIYQRLEFFTFYGDRINENRDIYLKFLCPYLEDEEVVEKVVLQQSRFGGLGWIEWCAQPEITLDPRSPLVYQTLPILNAMLEERFPKVFEDNSYDVENLLKSYLSETPDELFARVTHSRKFSGDVHTGALDLGQADLPTKVLIARAFIEALENPTPPISSAAWGNMLEVSCFIHRAEDSESCEDKAKRRIRKKLAAGAISLVRDVLSLPQESSLYGVSQAVQERDMEKYHLKVMSDAYAKVSHTGFPLTGFAEVYKGEEKRFAEDTLFASSPGRFLSPYTFLHDFICGDSNGVVNKEGWFSAPQMVNFAFLDEEDRRQKLSSICDLLNNNQVDSSYEGNPGQVLRNRYFHTPVTVGKILYPSVYEMVEDWLISFVYKSERTKQELLDQFGNQTKDTVLTATEKMRQDLRNLKANYIVPGLIDSTAVGRTQCHAIRDYYLPNYNVTEVSHGIVLRNTFRIEDLPNQLSVLRGLEIYLFQIQFWMNWMRTINYTVEGKDLNSFNSTDQSLDEVTCAVLELLKKYHDSFVDGTRLVYLTREEVEEIKNLNIPDALLEISTKSIYNGNAPVLLPPSLMLSLILKAAYPSDWKKLEDSLSPDKEKDLKADKKQDALMYAFAVGLKDSIYSFYGSLNLLYLSDGVEEAAHRQKTGLQLFE